MVGKSFDHFPVGEFQQPGPFLHQDHADAQRGEHASVLDADHSAAHHDEGLGDVLHVQDLVAVDDVAIVIGNLGGHRGLGAGGDDDVLGMVVVRSNQTGNADGMRVDKRGAPGQNLHAVARELRNGHVDFGLDDVLDPKGQVRHGDLLFDAVIDAIDSLVGVAGKMHHGLAQGLGRDGAGVDAGASHALALLHHRDLFPGLGALDGSPLAGRSRADHNHVEALHWENGL